jgi:hypothetical protein
MATHINQKNIKMKKAYLIRMSEDGNYRTIYTNVKALYECVINLYSVKFIEIWDCTIHKGNYAKLTYPNLVKALKSGRDITLTKTAEIGDYGTLEIEQVSISSK